MAICCKKYRSTIMSKIPVYFMPGLVLLFFERIQLPEADFEIHLLEWEIPLVKVFGRLRQENCLKIKRRILF
jgi:hypothetical protein